MEVFYDYIDNLDIEAKISLYRYTAFCSRANQLLFKGKKLIGIDKYYYQQIFDVFIKGPKVNETITLYRGMNTSVCKDFSGFISTTYNKETALEFTDRSKKCCLYTITVPIGDYSILPIEKISQYPNEKEVLLPPGKLNITGADSNGNIYCVYLPNFVNSFRIYELKDSTESYNSISDWIDDIESDLKSELDYIRNTYDEIDEFETQIIQVLSKLSYYNQLPEEVIIHFLTYNNKIDLKKFHDEKHEEYRLHVLLHNPSEKDFHIIWKNNYTDIKPTLEYIKFLLENSNILDKHKLIQYLYLFPKYPDLYHYKLSIYHSDITNKINMLEQVLDKKKLNKIIKEIAYSISNFNCKYYKKIYYDIIESIPDSEFESNVSNIMKLYNMIYTCLQTNKDTEFIKIIKDNLESKHELYTFLFQKTQTYSTVWIPYYNDMIKKLEQKI